MRKIWPVGVRLAINYHDGDLGRRVEMRKAWMRVPIHTQYLLRIELDLLMKRPAQRMQHPSLDRPAQRFGIDDEPAIVSTNEPLHPNVTGFAIHLDFCDLCDHSLTSECVRYSSTGQNISGSQPFRRRPRVPAVSLGGGLDHGYGPGSQELVVVGLARGEQFEPELDWIRLRCSSHLVDERLCCKGHLRTVRIAKVPSAKRRLPNQG